MSRDVKRKIAYWVMLILGIAILGVQFKRYYYGTLVLSVEEFIVFSLGATLTLRPLFLLEMLNKIISGKYGKGNGSE